MARKSVVRAVRTVGVAGALLAIAGGMNGAVAIVPATPVGATTPHGALSQLTLVNTRNVVTDLTKPVTTTKTQQFHSVAAQSDTAPDHVDLEWGSAPDPGHLQVVDSTPIVAGGVYQFYQGYSDGAGGHCGSPWPMEGSVIVDQVTFSPTGTLLTFAARVSCSGGADSFWGSVTTTVAYDITPTTPGSGYYLFQGTGQMFHVTATANRESIRRHGLDWRRMGAARASPGAPAQNCRTCSPAMKGRTSASS